MWRVSKEANELWIFGTLSPIPQKMQWDAASVEAILAETDEVISSPGVSVSANPFKGVFALPLLWGIRNSPEKKKLKDVVPAELYTRWLTQKALYIGSDRGIEKYRPIFAATELYTKAIDESGLEPDAKVHKKINKMIKKNKIPVTSTSVERSIEQPRKLIKAFKKSSLDDVDCLRKTIERLEVDLDDMRARATAWASGDLATLRSLLHEDQLEQKWRDAAVLALENNEVTFAMLPITDLLKPDGVVAFFKDQGYQVKGG
ncbi:MAG: hypothetical protein ACI9ON_003502 [Limisphaerales bacterium]|jgi:hypothetical protein